MQKKNQCMKESNPIKETTIQNDRLIHLRTIPHCIQPFINSLEKPPKIICKCIDHISLNQLNKEGRRPIKILSTANLLTFIEYDLPDFILPLSSLELLKLVNIYAYNAIQTLISLHNLCVMPDIFFKELNDSDLYTNYNNTVNFINEYVNQQRELLDLEFPPKEPDAAYKNIIEPLDLHHFLENEIMQIKNLSKTKEIILDFSYHEKILQDLCHESSIPLNSNPDPLYRKIQEDTSEEYKFVNLFKIPFLNTDKLLCVNLLHFNQLKFKCGVHNNFLFLNKQVFDKLSDSFIKVFVPLKVIFRENSLLFTEVLDINEDVGRILLKRVSSGDRILCDLEYSNISFDMSMFGGDYEPLSTEGDSMLDDELSKASNTENNDTRDSESENNGTHDSQSETENTHDSQSETENTHDSSTDTQINPIVRLPDNFDFRNPLKLHLNCQIPLKDTLLHGKVVEILEDINPYDVLLSDLKIQKHHHRYKTDFNFSVPDFDDHKTTSSENSDSKINEYFKTKNKTNISDNAELVNNTRLLTITIDPLTCTDIDDAVSFKPVETTAELSALLAETLKALNESQISSTPNNGYSKHQTLLLLNGVNKSFFSNHQTEGNFHEIFIHIADCSAFISPNSELDLSASIKGTSFYYETETETSKRIDMLPSILSSNLISLRAGLLRRALTVKILVYENSNHFLIIDYEFLNDTIVNKCKLSYEAAESILKGEYVCSGCLKLSQTSDLNTKYETSKNCVETDKCVECVQREFKLTTSFVSGDVADALNFLMFFTRTLKNNRGPSVLESILGSHQKDTDFLEGLTPQNSQNNDTHSLVEELMLLANQLAAIRIYNKSPHQTVLRVHKPTEFSLSSEFNLNKELSLSTELSLNVDSLPSEILKREIMKKMNQAKYRDTGHLLLSRDRNSIQDVDEVSETEKTLTDDRKKLKSSTACRHRDSPFYHFGLNIPIYTHFTSPIRRYADLLVHRVILSHLPSQLEHSNNKNNSNNENNKNNSTKCRVRISKEIINNLNRQTMKGKILNRISKQIRFVEKQIRFVETAAKKDSDHFAIIESRELKVFSLSFLEDTCFLKFYLKIYLPEEEIEGYISEDEADKLPVFSLIRVKIKEVKGNEILFTLIRK